MHLHTPTEPLAHGQGPDPELDALRALRATDTDLSPDQERERLTLGLARLERELESRQRPDRDPATRVTAVPRRRRTPALVLGGVAAAAALGIGIAALGPWAAVPEASAVELLEAAAVRAEQLPAALGNDQFLRVAEDWETLTMFSPAGEETATVPSSPITYRDRETIVTYVPADASGDWMVRGSGREFVEMVRPLDDPAAERQARAIAADESQGLGAAPSEESWPSGVPPLTGNIPDDPELRRVLAPYHEAPREPAALREHILAEIGPQEGAVNAAVYEWLLPVIRNASYPADLRAAGFGVLAEMAAAADGFSPVTDTREGQRVLTFPVQEGTMQELVFSAEGDLRESREVLVSPSEFLSGIEPGTVLSSVKIETAVVDAIPATD